MSSGGFGGVIPHIFPSLGPAILISMTYIDLGKWVAAVEGGARFGFDLVLPVLIFNCIAILCHYLSTCIGMVTGKNLAEICSEEYSRLACILLGVLAELSMIVSDLTMVLGVAHGLTLLFAMDLFSCILFAILGAFLLPFLLKLLDNGKAEAFYVSIACFALLFYVLGVLISQPEVPVVTNEFFPKLTGENAYSVMALLGANIMSHNFYIHSSIVQQQGRLSNIALGALFHDHFFAILFIFTGIFLVNYVLITSAAAVFGNTDVVALNFQDVSLVMEQIFKNPVAPVAFLLVLFFSCQTTALTRTIGGQVISQHLFGTKLSVWVHHFLSKSFTTFLAFYCARIGGAEGIYQSLIVCQIILGMLLPSAAIPLFRVASSRSIMGAFKTSWYTEILALLAFLGMLAANVIFIIEILFGNSSWTVSLKESNGTLYTFLLLGFTPTCFTMYLAVTPLKSASNKPESHISTRNSQKDLPNFYEGTEESNIEMIKYDEDGESVPEATFERCLESQSDRSTTEYNPDVSQAALDSDHDSQQSTNGSNIAVDVTSPAKHSDGSTSVAEERSPDLSYNDSTGCLHGEDKFHQNEFGEHVEVDVPPETDLLTVKNNEEADAVEPENFVKGLFAPLISEGPRPVNIAKAASKDVGNDSGSLSKLSGLGRAGRRQLAAILDEFWGNLFDFHGKLTQDASSKRLNILLGLDFKVASSSGKADSTAAESAKVLFSDTDKGQYFLQNSREYSSPRQINIQGADLPFGIQMGTSSWSHSMQQADAHVLSSGRNLFDPSERTYSSLHMPQCSDDRDYQPATIHGYQMPSYLRGINTGRTPYSSRSTHLPPTNKVSASYISTLRGQVMYSHGQNILGPVGTSNLQNPSLSRINTLQVERPYYEQPLMGTSEHAVSPAYTKKYHSSPDISAIVALTRNSYFNEGKQSTSIGPRTSFGRMASEQSRYFNPMSRTGTPLAFDELSPSKVHRDIFPLQPSLNSETKSLFSRQPFEELFGMVGGDHSGDRGAAGRSSITGQETFPYAESEAKLLHSLRFCIMKLLKLDGSDWLFSQNGGADEELIDQVAIAEKCPPIDTSEMSQPYADEFQYLSSDRKFNAVKRSEEGDLVCPSSLTNCGDGCVWRAALVVSFGVWCIQRVLELLVVESRPELWGKYTYVLNRLQGIIEPAFLKPRLALRQCTCLGVSVKCLTNFSSSSASGIPGVIERNGEKSLTTASTVLELIRDVEAAVSNRKGRTGTAAGDVAFPKGKENLASVLKRYKRRLSYKPLVSNEGTSMRKNPSSSSGL